MATPPEISAVIIPPFIKPNPSLWFYMVKATFNLATQKPKTDSKTKYNHVVAHLPPEIATVVRDIIMKPDPDDPYAALKSQIIARCSESKTAEIRRLLAGESLGDRRPSELFRAMKRLAESYCIDDSLLLELFIQALPVTVQTILASISPLTTEKAAEVADKICEIQSLNSVASVRACPSTTSQHLSTTESLIAAVKALRK